MRQLIFAIFCIGLLYIISCATVETNSIEKNSIKEFNKKQCNIKISVTGKGAPPLLSNLSEVQKYIFSERAAILDGYRLISERLSGMILKSLSRSDNFSISNDTIKTITNTFLKGVKIVSIKHKETSFKKSLE